MPASRRVTRAVSAVLDLAPRRGEISLPRLVDAVSADRKPPIELKMSDLPPGVCGQWRQYADRDVFLIQKGCLHGTARWPMNSAISSSATKASPSSKPPARRRSSPVPT
jgi:hypothetical protein